MAVRTVLRLSLALATPCGVVSASAAQAPRAPATVSRPVADTVHLIFDQQSRALTPASDGDNRLIAEVHGQTVHLRKPARVQLSVIHTNTAFYNVMISDTVVPPLIPFEAASSAAVANMVNLAHGFFPQALAVLTTTRGVRIEARWKSSLPDAAPPAATATMTLALSISHRMEGDVASLDSLFTGPRSVAFYHDHARSALQHMRATLAPETAAQQFRDSVGWRNDQQCRSISGDTLHLGSRLLAHYQALRPRIDSLDRALTDSAFALHPGFRDSLITFRHRADSAVQNAQQLTPAAYVTEHLFTVITGACSHQEAVDQLAGTPSAGRRFIVAITRRSEADIAPIVADLPDPPATVVVNVLPPRPVVSISAGLSLLFAPNARYPTFGTRTDSTTGTKGAQIYQPGVTDARYSWGATIGLSWRFLDWSTSSGAAVWLPEVTIEQLQGTSGFALGSAVSWRSVKVGSGLLWVQHSALEGSRLGDHIPNSGYLQVVSSYARPKWYLSISVFGVPGFISK